MVNSFIFSNEHLIILLIFSFFIYICPKLTNHLLPYSYIVEKIICGLMILEIVFEQVSLLSMGGYSVSTSLPIDICRFTSYICIAILLFKQYQLFNVFFSWSIVCAIGEIIFFKSIPYRFPNVLYVFSVFSKCLIIYANIYLIDVRKFKVNSSAIKDNFLMCLTYFPFIFLLNKLTSSHYPYVFSNENIISIILFIILTTLMYVPTLISSKENNSYKLKSKNK